MVRAPPLSCPYTLTPETRPRPPSLSSQTVHYDVEAAVNLFFASQDPGSGPAHSSGSPTSFPDRCAFLMKDSPEFWGSGS